MARARELGIEIGRLPPGPADAITDVDGVSVGHTTLIEDDSVRTGVSVVVPPPNRSSPERTGSTATAS